ITLSNIYNIKSDTYFNAIDLNVFKFQYENNTVYRSFCDLLYKNPSDVKRIEDIPFLPIQFFKSHEVVSDSNSAEIVFTSSGTTGSMTSKHYVTHLKLYEQSFKQGFEEAYGNIEDYVVLALLPSYLEREGSSLIYMVEQLIKDSKQPESGFYLHNLSELKDTLIRLDSQHKKVLLIG